MYCKTSMVTAKQFKSTRELSKVKWWNLRPSGHLTNVEPPPGGTTMGVLTWAVYFL